MLLERYNPVSKKLNHKNKVNNFVALPRESVSSFWDRFTSFVRGVTNYPIDDESLKEYFYIGQDDNNKEVTDTIEGGSYVEILEKWEKISRKKKAWSPKRSDIGRNNFVVKYTNNPFADKIHEEMSQNEN